MKYKVTDLDKETRYKKCEYYVDSVHEVYRIIYDCDRGYALLHMSSGEISSDFQESIHELIEYTTISNMKHVVQINEVKFKVD